MAVERFADFLLFEELASRPWGHTFRAGSIHGARIDHHVKLFVFDGNELDETAFWQLVAERQSIAEQVADPHLARLSAIGRAGPTPFAAYHHDPGSSLADFLAAARAQDFPLPVDQALFIIERIALALRAAFDRELAGEPIVHGFLLPELVHLSSEGEVRVLGLEIAPGLQRLLGGHPLIRRHLGPEAVTGSPATPADDVFSLGLLLAELLIGRSPSTQSRGSAPEELAAAELSVDSEPMPEGLRMLLQRSFAPLDERIRNVAEWQQELSRIILEGDYNPTTFNLSFLLHTLVRGEIAAETERMAAESETLAPGSSEVAEDPQPELPPATPRAAPRRHFLSGFLTSFLGSLVLLAALFLVRSMTRADGATPQEATPAPSGELRAALVEPSLEDPKPRAEAAASDEAVPAETQADERPDPAPDQSPNAADADPRPAPKLEELVDTRVRDLEQTLRDEYERQLEELRQRLEAAEAEEPDQPRTADVDDAAAEAEDLDRQRTTDADDAAVTSDGSPAAPPSAPESPLGLEIRPPAELEPQALGPTSEARPLPVPEPAADDSQAPADEAVGSSTAPEPADESLPIVSTEPAGQIGDLSPGPQTSSPIAADSASTSPPAVPVYAPPRLVRHPSPPYPAVARRLRREAVIRVRVLIDAAGVVRDATLVDETEVGLGLDQAALSAAERSRWAPATRDGEPVEASAVLTIEFKL